MTVLAPWPDVEDAIVGLLDDLGTAGTWRPPDVVDAMPFLHVRRFAGSDDVITDAASVDVDVFAATRGEGLPLAESVRQLMIATPHSVVTDAGTVVIDRVTTAGAPVEVSWGDSRVRRWTSSYRVTLRR